MMNCPKSAQGDTPIVIASENTWWLKHHLTPGKTHRLTNRTEQRARDKCVYLQSLPKHTVERTFSISDVKRRNRLFKWRMKSDLISCHKTQHSVSKDWNLIRETSCRREKVVGRALDFDLGQDGLGYASQSTGNRRKIQTYPRGSVQSGIRGISAN